MTALTNFIIKALSLTVMIFIVSACSSVPEEYKEQQLIDQYFQITNLSNKSDEIPKMIQLTMSKQKVIGIDKKTQAFLQRSIALNFDAQLVLNEVRISIRQAMNSKQLKQINANLSNFKETHCISK